MIKVNLLPGGKKRAKSRNLSFTMPDFKGFPMDRWVLGSGAVTAVALVAMGYLFLSTNSRNAELTVGLEAAVQDSARYAELIRQSDHLQARRDSIAEKVAIIQEIDGARYIWPHLLDEVARALPDYTWLTNMLDIGATDSASPIFRIQGRAGNIFALTRFMENLEASPFIRNVQLMTTAATMEGAAMVTNQRVYQFTLEAAYDTPPSELLQTVPLLGSAAGTQ
ncbi:MAG: PilN domain-containing protein [Gemmatimonadota bacterium]